MWVASARKYLNIRVIYSCLSLTGKLRPLSHVHRSLASFSDVVVSQVDNRDQRSRRFRSQRKFGCRRSRWDRPLLRPWEGLAQSQIFLYVNLGIGFRTYLAGLKKSLSSSIAALGGVVEGLDVTVSSFQSKKGKAGGEKEAETYVVAGVTRTEGWAFGFAPEERN